MRFQGFFQQSNVNFFLCFPRIRSPNSYRQSTQITLVQKWLILGLVQRPVNATYFFISGSLRAFRGTPKQAQCAPQQERSLQVFFPGGFHEFWCLFFRSRLMRFGLRLGVEMRFKKRHQPVDVSGPQREE